MAACWAAGVFDRSIYRISRPSIRLQKIVQGWRLLKLMSVNCISDQPANLDEADFPGRKGGDGGFVGGIEHRAQRAAFAGDPIAERQGWEAEGIRFLKIEREGFTQIENRADAGQTLRVC